jgi:hypothetical protein
MAPSYVDAGQKELGYPATTPLRLGLKHVGCMELTKAEMFYEVRTIRSIKMAEEQSCQKKAIENHQSYC